jgi:hypothetical protein
MSVAVRPPTGRLRNRARSLVIAGIVASVIVEILTWYAAGSIWWSFRGLLRGGPGSEAGIADARFAAVMFAVAAANAAMLILFLVRRRRTPVTALGVLQAADIVASITLTLLFDVWWVVAVVAAVMAFALIVAYRLATRG